MKTGNAEGVKSSGRVGWNHASDWRTPRTSPGGSFATSTSADGRYTVFTSTATNLIPNQVTVNSSQNVFLYDKTTATIRLVNHVPGFDNTTGDGGVVELELRAVLLEL